MGSFVFTLSWLAFCYACIRMIERRPIPFAYLTDGSTYGASASRALEISTALVPAAPRRESLRLRPDRFSGRIGRSNPRAASELGEE